MKKLRIIAITAMLVVTFTFSAFAAISTVFTGKSVSSAGVTVKHKSTFGATYHLYQTGTDDHSQVQFLVDDDRTSESKTVKPRSGNYGTSHYFQVEYGSTYPSFSYSIN